MAESARKKNFSTRSRPLVSERPGQRPELAAYGQPRYLVRRLQQASVALFLEETQGFDITPVQYGVLVTVNNHPGIDQITLANSIYVDRASIVSVVDRLEARGLLVRKLTSRDRRLRTLFVTSAGAALLAKLASAADRAQQRILEPLSPRERTQFIEMLQRLTQHHSAAMGTQVDPRSYEIRSHRLTKRTARLKACTTM